MSQEIYKLLPFLKPISGSAKTTPEQKTKALQRQSAEQIRQGGGLTGQTKTKELYKVFPFLQPAAGNSQPKASGTKIKIGDKYYDTGFHSKEIGELRKKYPGGGNAAQSMTEFQPPVISDPGPPSPSADPRNAAYLSARAKLTKDSTAEDIKKVEDIGMTAWAKANPELAAKVKAGQSGYGAIQDALGLSSKDEREAASDMMVMGTNPEEAMARAKGGIVEVDIDASGVGPAKINPQGFKDEKMMSLMSTLKDPNITPIVKDMELPDMSKYAGIFNQTDAPDYKTMMENAAMGQLAENLGLSTKGYDTSNYFDRMFGK